MNRKSTRTAFNCCCSWTNEPTITTLTACVMTVNSFKSKSNIAEERFINFIRSRRQTKIWFIVTVMFRRLFTRKLCLILPTTKSQIWLWQWFDWWNRYACFPVKCSTWFQWRGGGNRFPTNFRNEFKTELINKNVVGLCLARRCYFDSFVSSIISVPKQQQIELNATENEIMHIGVSLKLLGTRFQIDFLCEKIFTEKIYHHIYGRNDNRWR